MAHTCPARGCDARLPDKILFCRPHWYALPKPLRDAIWATYRPGQERDGRPSQAYLANVRQAIRVIAAKEGRAA